MKKGIWILLFLYICLPLRAQNSKELIEILLDFCQQVTQEEPSEEKIYAIFQSISPEKRYLLLEEKKSSFAGFTQFKDTKKSNYIYQNPQTHKKVVFSILSYNPPEAPYNIIYRIEIEDIRFFDEASLRKGKFYHN